MVDVPRNLVENIESIRSGLNQRKFLKGDLALFAIEHRDEIQRRLGGSRSDDFPLFESFSSHPYHVHVPQDGDAYFLKTDADLKSLSPSATSRCAWKASGSPQALHLAFLRNRNTKSIDQRAPLCVYNNYHYSVDVPSPSIELSGGKRTTRAKLLTMRVYTIHDGLCDCNACRRSREQALAKRSAAAILAQDYALVMVLDAVASGVWKKKRTSDEADSDLSAASTPSSSDNSSELAVSARTARSVIAGGQKGTYVRPLIFSMAEEDLRTAGESIVVDSMNLTTGDV